MSRLSEVGSLIAVAVLCCGASLLARTLDGVTMPDMVTVDDRVLRLNGMGVGKKLFV